MNVKHIMTWPVFSIGPDATVLQAVQLMLRHKISGLPVVDADGKLLGIVTEGDFLRRAEIATERHRPRWLNFLVGPGPPGGRICPHAYPQDRGCHDTGAIR